MPKVIIEDDNLVNMYIEILFFCISHFKVLNSPNQTLTSNTPT